MGEGEKEEEEDNQGSCPTTCLKFWETLFYCCGSCMKNFCIPNLTKRTKEDCAVCNGINKNEFAWKEINKSAGTDKQGISKKKATKNKTKTKSQKPKIEFTLGKLPVKRDRDWKGEWERDRYKRWDKARPCRQHAAPPSALPFSTPY